MDAIPLGTRRIVYDLLSTIPHGGPKETDTALMGSMHTKALL